MSESLRRLGEPIDASKMDVVGTMENIMENGHAIYGETMWIHNRDKRVMKVIETPVFHDLTPVIGYGRGDTADQALLRALYTYSMKNKPRRYVDPDELPESSTSPLSISHALTKLDFIVNDGDFCLYVDDNVAIAESKRNYEAGGGTFIGEGLDAVSSVNDMVNTYPFPFGKVLKLPVTLLWDITDS
ncbi:MAG: hypothetical protein JWN75_626 [Candidatus Saccharibacteria bacterium]|nr:hypothetical protein [Candidatus Saccharibacteria bacterium]